MPVHHPERHRGDQRGATTTSGKSILSTRQVNDDRTRVSIAYDARDESIWDSRVTVSDSAGRKDIVTQYNDDGSRVVTDYDLAKSETWASRVDEYDARNRLDKSAVTGDDGVMIVTDLDPGDRDAWASIVTTYAKSSSSRIDFLLQTNDDASRIETDYDALGK